MNRRDSVQTHWIEHPTVQGGGQDVVLLHGLGSSAEDWLLQAPVLQDRHRVIAVDLPGFGKSPGLRGLPSMAAYARAVAGTMDQAGMRQAHVIGLSLGGAVALQLGLDEPERVLSLTLVNSFASLHVGLAVIMRTSVRFGYVLLGRMDLVGRWVAEELFPGPQQEEVRRVAAEHLGKTRRRSYLQAGQAIRRFDVRKRLGEIRCPTLVVAGEQDTTVPLAAKEEMVRGIPGARLARFAGSGHATPIDEAQAFNQAVEAFLEQVERGEVGPRVAPRRIEGDLARLAT